MTSTNQYFKNISTFEKFDNTDTMYPTQMQRVSKDIHCATTTSTYYGFIYDGKFTLSYKNKLNYEMGKFSFFSATGDFNLKGQGEAILIERFGYRGLFQTGILEEDKGRLCYIDNASTTILIHPARLGDPCLNLLTFPPNIVQSSHIHPTVRLGMVLKGSGECITNKKNKLSLTPGLVFNLVEGLEHSFNSFSEGLHVLAFHPDSDVGPTDHSHPMLNRTYLTKRNG